MKIKPFNQFQEEELYVTEEEKKRRKEEEEEELRPLDAAGELSAIYIAYNTRTATYETIFPPRVLPAYYCDYYRMICMARIFLLDGIEYNRTNGHVATPAFYNFRSDGTQEHVAVDAMVLDFTCECGQPWELDENNWISYDVISCLHCGFTRD